MRTILTWKVFKKVNQRQLLEGQWCFCCPRKKLDCCSVSKVMSVATLQLRFTSNLVALCWKSIRIHRWLTVHNCVGAGCHLAALPRKTFSLTYLTKMDRSVLCQLLHSAQGNIMSLPRLRRRVCNGLPQWQSLFGLEPFFFAPNLAL